TSGTVGDVIFQTRDKPNNKGLGQQLSGMFNSRPSTGEFGLYAVENPTDIYRTILAQASATSNSAKNDN
ncbi:MAG: hypothetical protein WB562_01915, partial [Candidatus Sulfotelmatobacter sp.]